MGIVHAEGSDTNVLRFDQSGALLRKVMESAAVGMALVGIDRRTIYVNRAYEAMLGFSQVSASVGPPRRQSSPKTGRPLCCASIRCCAARSTI